MTTNIYALENTRARLFVKSAKICGDRALADSIIASWKAAGFIVNVVEEN